MIKNDKKINENKWPNTYSYQTIIFIFDFSEYFWNVNNSKSLIGLVNKSPYDTC